jgi:hypothetical protein
MSRARSARHDHVEGRRRQSCVAAEVAEQALEFRARAGRWLVVRQHGPQRQQSTPSPAPLAELRDGGAVEQPEPLSFLERALKPPRRHDLGEVEAADPMEGDARLVPTRTSGCGDVYTPCWHRLKPPVRCGTAMAE